MNENPMREWSFLTDHAIVLAYLAKQPGSTVRQITSVTGVSERALRKVITDLNSAGYITKKQEDREFGYSVAPGLESHQDIERDASLRDLLEALR